MNHPLVILIATAGRPVDLQQTLESLAECELPEELVATYVVENGPPQGAKNIAEAASPRLKIAYRHSEPPNKSLALNLALNEIDGSSLVYFTDDDITFDPGVLTRYCAAARDYDRGAFFGGPFNVQYERRPPAWLIPLLPLSAQGWDPAANEASRRPLMIGFNWAAFAKDMRAAGGFDPRFGPGATTGATGQEHQMQQRLLAAGVQPVFVPDARVWHKVPSKRCTPEFAVQRRYRFGLHQGHSLSRDDSATLGGVPRWRVRQLWQLRVSYLASWLQFDPAKRLKSRLAVAHARGILDGLRAAQTTTNITPD